MPFTLLAFACLALVAARRVRRGGAPEVSEGRAQGRWVRVALGCLGTGPLLICAAVVLQHLEALSSRATWATADLGLALLLTGLALLGRVAKQSDDPTDDVL